MYAILVLKWNVFRLIFWFPDRSKFDLDRASKLKKVNCFCIFDKYKKEQVKECAQIVYHDNASEDRRFGDGHEK